MKTRYENGKIYIEQGYFEDSFIEEDGKFFSIGDSDTKVDKTVDLKGKTVIPGLNDSHLHLMIMSENLNRVNLRDVESRDEIIERSKEFINNSEEPIDFLYSTGWNQDNFTKGSKKLLNKYDLDQISTDIPIVLDRVCNHITALNTKALEVMGIDKDTVIEGGEIRLGEDGEPNGILTEAAAFFAKEQVPGNDKETSKKILLDGMDYALKHGVTSVQSCDIFDTNYEFMPDIIVDIYKNQEHPLRYDPQFNCQNMNHFKDYYEKYYCDDSLYNDTFTKGALKVIKDGSLGGRTAHMKQPYADDPDTCGIESLPNKKFKELVDFAQAHDIRIATHAIGNQAVQDVVDIYIEAMDEGNPNRYGVVHCQITDKEQLKQMAEHDIIAYYQPVFLDYDMTIVEDRVGKELAKTSYAFKTLYDLNPKLTSFGTDCPVESIDPFGNIYHAVTRKQKSGEPEGGFYPEECMTVEESIDCYTEGSAYAQFMENVKGRIKPGYLADFVVLEQDIFTIDPEDIKDVEVAQTYISGELVYEKK